MAGAKHTTTFNVSLDALWDVITDYEGYVGFVEGLKSLEVTEREENVVVADYEVSMAGKTVRYTLKHVETPKKSLKWEMVEGEFLKHNNGGWELKAKGDDKVEATYTVDIGLPFFVPKTFVDMLTGTQLPSMMKAFEERAKAGGKPKKKAAAGKKAPAKGKGK